MARASLLILSLCVFTTQAHSFEATVKNGTGRDLFYRSVSEEAALRIDLEWQEGGESFDRVMAGATVRFESTERLLRVNLAGGVASMEVEPRAGRGLRIEIGNTTVQGVTFLELAIVEGQTVRERELIYMPPERPKAAPLADGDDEEVDIDALLAKKARLESELLRTRLQDEIRGMEQQLTWREQNGSLYYPYPTSTWYTGSGPVYSSYSGYAYPGLWIVRTGFPRMHRGYRNHWRGGFHHGVRIGWGSGGFYHGSRGWGLRLNHGNFHLRARVR